MSIHMVNVSAAIFFYKNLFNLFFCCSFKIKITKWKQILAAFWTPQQNELNWNSWHLQIAIKCWTSLCVLNAINEGSYVMVIIETSNSITKCLTFIDSLCWKVSNFLMCVFEWSWLCAFGVGFYELSLL